MNTKNSKKTIGCVQHDCPECQKRIEKERREQEVEVARESITKMFTEWHGVDADNNLEILKFAAKWLSPSITGSDTWKM